MVIWRPLWLIDDTDLAWVSEDYGAFAWLYEYDVYGNLVYAGSPCAGEYEAAYDAFGRRVWERIAPTGQSAIETHFVYDGDALVLELSPNGQPLVQYVQGLLGPIARVDLQNGANARYYVLDARGHARAMVDSTGSVTDYYEYDAWGNVLPGSFGSTPGAMFCRGVTARRPIRFGGTRRAATSTSLSPACTTSALANTTPALPAGSNATPSANPPATRTSIATAGTMRSIWPIRAGCGHLLGDLDSG